MKVKLVRNEIYACWFAIKKVIENEIPSNEDRGFLMETMGETAKQERSDYLNLPFNKMRGIWYCLNICANNKLFKNEGQQGMMLSAQSKIAVELDKEIKNEKVMEKDPLVLLDKEEE